MMSHNYCGGEDYLIALGETRAIAQFISHLEQGQGYSKETLDLYHDYLIQLLEYFVRHASTVHKKPLWNNLDKQVLVSYNTYLCGEGDAQKMIANKFNVIASFFNYMVSSGMLGINPLEDSRSSENTKEEGSSSSRQSMSTVILGVMDKNTGEQLSSITMRLPTSLMRKWRTPSSTPQEERDAHLQKSQELPEEDQVQHQAEHPPKE